jgi:hypothetical protein
VQPTTEGVVRDPSLLEITSAVAVSQTATTELVVPRSMPTVFAMGTSLWRAGDLSGPKWLLSGIPPNPHWLREALSWPEVCGIPKEG